MIPIIFSKGCHAYYVEATKNYLPQKMGETSISSLCQNQLLDNVYGLGHRLICTIFVTVNYIAGSFRGLQFSQVSYLYHFMGLVSAIMSIMHYTIM